jgi:predicted lipase
LEGKDFPLTFPGFKNLTQFNLVGDKCFGVAGNLIIDPTVMIIAFRGTQNVEDLLEDTHFAQVPFGSDNNIMCHEGFFKVFNSLAAGVNSFVKSQGVTRIILTGHSLGAAVALLFGASQSLLPAEDGRRLSDNLNLSVVTYACPRVGNQEFMNHVNKNLFVMRFRNDADAVPNFPAAVSPNEHIPSNPFMYYHCGLEYAFQSNWFSVLNNHMIPVYMEFLNSLTSK